MKANLPKIPDEMQNMNKGVAAIQLVCFLVIFLTIYLLLRKVVHALPLRILILLADYFVTAMISYTLIRPAAMKLDEKLKKK